MKENTNNLENHLKKQYSNTSEGIEFFWHKLRSRFVFKTIKKYLGLSNTINIGDIGAGAGILGNHFRVYNHQIKYFFLEPIEFLAEKLRLNFGSNSQIEYSDLKKMNLITLMDVLEHQEEDVKFLKEIEKNMRSNSYLLITVPAFRLLWSEWDVKLGHFRRYNKSNLIKAVKESGLEIVEARYLFQSMFLVGLIRKFLPSGDVEFPVLSKGFNKLLFGLGVFEQEIGSKFLPFGSSVVLIAKKK